MGILPVANKRTTKPVTDWKKIAAQSNVILVILSFLTNTQGKINTTKEPLQLVRLFLSTLLLCLAGASQAATIAEGRISNNTFTVEDRQGDSASIRLSVAYRLWPLVGEPVRLCVARWSLRSVNIDGRIHSANTFPENVWQQATLYSAKVRINLNPYGNAGENFVSFLCDLGVMGPPDGKTASFNSPGSPSWNSFLLQGVNVGTSQDGDPYSRHGLSKDRAKAYAKALMRQYQPPRDNAPVFERPWGMELWEASINLWPLRRHLRSEARKAGAQARGGPGRTPAIFASPGTGSSSGEATKTPSNIPDRASLMRQAGINSNNLNRHSLSEELDLQQKRQGSDKSLKLPTQDQKAPVSGVTVPHEPASNNADAALLLLVDTSGSMGGNRLRDAKKAAKDVIDNAVRQNTEVAVLSFSGDCSNPIPSRHPFSRDKNSLRRFVNGLSDGGGTPMSAAVEYANRYMAINRSPGNQSEMIILLADGDDSCNILSPVVRELKHDGVLFRHQTVGLEIGSGSSAARDLKHLARDSGGNYQYAADSSQLNETFRRAMLAMEMLDMLGRFGEEKASSPREQVEPNSTQNILDGFDP